MSRTPYAWRNIATSMKKANHNGRLMMCFLAKIVGSRQKNAQTSPVHNS